MHGKHDAPYEGNENPYHLLKSRRNHALFSLGVDASKLLPLRIVDFKIGSGMAFEDALCRRIADGIEPARRSSFESDLRALADDTFYPWELTGRSRTTEEELALAGWVRDAQARYAEALSLQPDGGASAASRISAAEAEYEMYVCEQAAISHALHNASGWVRMHAVLMRRKDIEEVDYLILAHQRRIADGALRGESDEEVGQWRIRCDYMKESRLRIIARHEPEEDFLTCYENPLDILRARRNRTVYELGYSLWCFMQTIYDESRSDGQNERDLLLLEELIRRLFTHCRTEEQKIYLRTYLRLLAPGAPLA